MEYDRLEILKEEIRASKAKPEDPLPMASILSIEQDINKTTELLDEFKKSSIYKNRVLKALNYFEDITKKWDKEVAEKGDKSFCDRSEKQWYIDNKAHLKRLQKEAKRLKIK